MSKASVRAGVLVLSGLLALPAAAGAATVGPGLAWSGGSAYPLSPILGSTAYVAVRFSVSDLFVPTALDVVINQTSVQAGMFYFDIVTGSSSAPSLSSVVANFTLATTGAFGSSPVSPTLTTVPAPTLMPATDYWLVGYAASGTVGAWNRDNVNNPAATVVFDFGVGPIGDSVSPAFLLTGTSPIPLPAASLMGGALLMGLLGRRLGSR